jgi:hypothetical protein
MEREASVLRLQEPATGTATILNYVRFWVLATVIIKIFVFWVVTPYSLVDCYRRFYSPYYPLLHRLWIWRQQVALKRLCRSNTIRRYIPEDIHLDGFAVPAAVTAVFFIVPS